MADRSFLPPAGSLEVNVVEIFCEVNVGATGAVSSSSGKGCSTVTRTSAGLYRVPLSDSYNKLLWAGVTLLDDTDSAATTVGIGHRLEAEDVDGTSPYVDVQFYALDDGAAADPADGAKWFICMKLRNSSVS